MKKEIVDSNRDNHKLRNFSQVKSLNRLSDPDSQVVAQTTAGGDEDYLRKDIEDGNYI